MSFSRAIGSLDLMARFLVAMMRFKVLRYSVGSMVSRARLI